MLALRVYLMLRTWFLMSFPQKRGNQGSLEKWLTLELGKETYKMTLKHLTVPESKKMVGIKKTYMHGGTSKGHRNNKELRYIAQETIFNIL